MGGSVEDGGLMGRGDWAGRGSAGGTWCEDHKEKGGLEGLYTRNLRGGKA